MHTPPRPPRQGRESPRGDLSDSCRLKVRGYIFESHSFWGRESPRADPSSFRMGRGVLHTPPCPPRQGQESSRVALPDSCRLRVCGYIFESHSFWGWESPRMALSSFQQGRGVLHTPHNPTRQERESRRVALSSFQQGRGVLHTPHNPPRQGRESQRMVLSSFRQGRGVLHTPHNPPRQGRESQRVALPDSCRLRVKGYIFESHPFWG